MYILHCSRFPGSLEMDSCIIIIIKISSAERSPLGATSHGTLKSVSTPRLPKKPPGFNIFGCMCVSLCVKEGEEKYSGDSFFHSYSRQRREFINAPITAKITTI